jgi:hypothetical protein
MSSYENVSKYRPGEKRLIQMLMKTNNVSMGGIVVEFLFNHSFIKTTLQLEFIGQTNLEFSKLDCTQLILIRSMLLLYLQT